MQEQPGYNTNENVTVLMKAMIQSPEINQKIIDLAREIQSGKRDSLPEAYKDLFTTQIVTRPSGSKYVVVDWA